MQRTTLIPQKPTLTIYKRNFDYPERLKSYFFKTFTVVNHKKSLKNKKFQL